MKGGNNLAELSENSSGYGGMKQVFTISLALFIIFLDGSIVNIALPSIIKEYSTDLGMASWIINAYVITVAVFLVFMGKIGDMLGRAKFYNIGLVMFMLSSFFCALSTNVEMLILFRFFQGISGAIVIPTSMSLVRTAVPPEKVGSAMGVWGAVGGLAIAIGPALGGVITEVSDWRWMFYINLPVITIALFLNKRIFQHLREKTQPLHFDVWGTITLSVTLFVLIYTVIKGPDVGWMSWPIIGGFTFSILGVGVFYWIEHKISYPLVDFELFTNKLYVVGLISNLLGGILLSGMMMILPILLTEAMEFTSLQAAYFITPLSAAMLITAPVTGRLIDRFGFFVPMIIGYIISVIGFYLLTSLELNTPTLSILWRIGVIGVGIAMIAVTSLTVSTVSVQSSQSSVASGIFAMVRNVGGAIGVSLFVSVIMTSFNHFSMVSIQDSIQQIHSTSLSTYEKSKLTDALKAQQVSFFDRNYTSHLESLEISKNNLGEWKKMISDLRDQEQKNKVTAIHYAFIFGMLLSIFFSISAMFLLKKSFRL